MRHNDHPPGRLTFSGGRNFRWQAQGRPCSYARVWRPEDPRHGSNGSTITVQPNGEVYVRCLHLKCQQHGSVEGEYLGMLFDEPRQTTGSGGAVLVVQQGVALSETGRERDGQTPEPTEQRISVPSEQTVQAPKSTGQCLRQAMRQTQLDYDGHFSRPLPAEPPGRLQPAHPTVLDTPPRPHQELQRVKTWLSAPGRAPSPPR